MAKRFPGSSINRAGTGIVIRGVLELEQTLTELNNQIAGRVVAKAAEEAANVIMFEAKRLCPVDTGLLRNSIHVEKNHISPKIRKGNSKNKKLKAIERTSFAVVCGEGFFKGDTFYSGFVEFGTKKMPARPFMRRAAHNKRNAVAKIFRDAINRAIKSSGGRRKAHVAIKNIKTAID